MHKRSFMILAALFCFLLTGCSVLRPAPEKDLDKMLHLLQKGKISKAERYIYEDSFGINTKNRQAKRFYSRLFGSISYTITNSVSDGEYAQVTVNITTLDMQALVEESSLEALENRFMPGGKSDFYKHLLQKMESGTAPSASWQATVFLVREDRRWKVSLISSPDFTEAITGGVSQLLGY